MSEELIKLDVGCGSRCRDGYKGLDKSNLPGVGYVVDMEKHRLPFGDSSVETIYCNHMLEHIQNCNHVLEPVDSIVFVMNEFHRVLIPDGLLEIGVPSAGAYDNDGKFIIGGGAFRDPTHRRFITQDTFYYWTEGYMTNADYGIKGYFNIEDIKLIPEYREGHLPGVNMEVKMRAIK